MGKSTRWRARGVALGLLLSAIHCGRIGFDPMGAGDPFSESGASADGGYDAAAGPCGDIDHDTCDDCSSGTYDPMNDGPDADGDGLCDAVSDCPLAFIASGSRTGGIQINGCGGVAETGSPGLRMSTASEMCANVHIGESIVLPFGTSEYSFVLTRADETSVNDMANCLTDGIDDVVSTGVLSYGGVYESTFFGISPDLVGYRIVEFRGTVHSMDASYNANQDRCEYSWSLTWELWGHASGCP